jgi:nitrogen fixation protein NifX
MMAITRKLQVVDDRDNSTLLKVAFATSDNQQVDQHFGSARAFAIYGVDIDSARLLQMAEFAEIKAEDEDKLAEKLQVLEGCIAVYCRACGASAVRQLLVRTIQPVKVNDGTDIRGLISALQQELRDGPSSWLAKAMHRQTLMANGRFDDMEADGWRE